MRAPVGTATSAGTVASDGTFVLAGTGTAASAETFAPAAFVIYSGLNAVTDLCLLLPSTVMFHTAAQFCCCAASICELPSSGHMYLVLG